MNVCGRDLGVLELAEGGVALTGLAAGRVAALVAGWRVVWVQHAVTRTEACHTTIVFKLVWMLVK